MKNKLLSIALAAVAFVGINTTASAFQESYFYVAGTGIFGWAGDTELTSVEFKDTNNSNSKKLGASGLDFKGKRNYGGSFEVGYGMDFFRVGLEGIYMQSNTKDLVLNKENKNKFTLTNEKGQKFESNVTAGDLKFDQKNRNLALMLNLYYDIPVTECIDLYVGGGIGFTKFTSELKPHFSKDYAGLPTKDSFKTHKIDEILFAWQVKTGVVYHIDDNWALTAGYRFFKTAKPKGFEKGPHSHSIELGVRYSF